MWQQKDAQPVFWKVHTFHKSVCTSNDRSSIVYSILLQKSYTEYELHTPDDEQMKYMMNGQIKYMASEHHQFAYY